MQQHPESPADGRPGWAARILVIDDEEDVRALVQEALEEAGYEVVVTSRDPWWGSRRGPPPPPPGAARVASNQPGR
jgi:CheY-like chemotaxis protein